MKLIIKNLGSIKNNTQSIDLSKRFYVFVGKNNSGKTYVSQLLWTIFNEEIVNKFSAQVEKEKLTDFCIKENDTFEITQRFVESVLKQYSEFLKIEIANTYNTRKRDIDFVENFAIEFQYDLEHFQKCEIQADFNFTLVELNNSEKSDDSEHKKELRYLVISKENNSLIFKFQENELNKSFFDELPNTVLETRRNFGIKHIIVSSTLGILLKHNHETFFLPSSRVFYSIFYQYIYDIDRKKREEDIKRLLNLLEENQRKQQKVGPQTVRELQLFQRPYTEPMNQVFEALYSLNQDREIVSYYDDLVEKLSQIMGGTIEMKSLEGISPIEFYFSFNEAEQDLPMYLASSSANQLVLLYLYLKYWVAEKNNFLMIDEPEENLHPENQVLLLDLLVQFATNKENKVLITTHSPLLANFINNYIYLDVLKNKYGFSESKIQKIVENNGLKYINIENSIAKDLVSVYFFDGHKIIDYEAEDYGVYFRDFRSVTEAVELSQKILTDYIYMKELEDE